jgi:hypothetical protein
LEIKSFIQQELLRRGVLWAAYHALCYAHTDEDIEVTLSAYDGAFAEFRKAVESNRPLRGFIEGEPVQPVFRKVTDFNAHIQQAGRPD